MKRYNVWDEIESLRGDYILFTDHEAEVKKLKQKNKNYSNTVTVLTNRIITLEEQNREMFETLKQTQLLLGINRSAMTANQIKRIIGIIEKIEGDSNE